MHSRPLPPNGSPPGAPESRVQLAIVGAGPAGIAAAVQAATRGLSHVLLERGELANTIHRYRNHKHVMAEPTRMELNPGLALEFEAGSREAVLEQLDAAVRSHGVHLLRGPQYELLDLQGELGAFTLQLQNAPAVHAERVILAIGTAGSPRSFGVPGEHLPHVHSGIQDPARCADESVTVVGAGDSAIEEALALCAADADVTLAHRGRGFPRAKGRNRSAIEAKVASGQIRELSCAHVLGLEPGGIWLELRDPDGDAQSEERWVPSDTVVGCLGAQPPLQFLERLGIELERAPGSADAAPRLGPGFETSRPGIHLIGEVAGCPLIKPALNQGYEVIERLLGHPVQSPHIPLLREALAPLGLEPERAVEAVHKSIHLLRSLSPGQVESLLASAKARVARAGECIYARGEFSETLFALYDGEVQLRRGSPSRKRGAPFQPEPERVRNGGFFGASSVLSGRPRSETARACRDSLLIEIPALELRRLMRTEDELGRRITEAATHSALAELFPLISAEERRQLAAASVFERHEPGAVLFREGDRVDGIYVFVRGSAAVSRERDGHDRVINHVRAGEYIGEIALVHPSRSRTASVKTTVLSETLRIPADVIADLTHYPALHDSFQNRLHKQIAADERMLEGGEPRVLDFLISKGAKEATDLLVIDETLCIRCDNCERACAETHAGVSRLDREGGSRFAGVHLPTACQHCENPLCMTDCPPNALQRHSSGEVYILDSCIGCGNCADDCPYDVIVMQKLDPDRAPRGLLWQLLFGASPESRRWFAPDRDAQSGREVAVKCDLCRAVPGVAEGERSVACVASCPTGAILRRRPDACLEDTRAPLRSR